MVDSPINIRWMYLSPSSCEGSGDNSIGSTEQGNSGSSKDDACLQCDIYDLYNSVLYELRSSLQGLKGCLEILKESGNSSDRDEVLATANQCAFRMNDLVESMGGCLKGTPTTPLIEEVPSVLTELCSAICDQYRLEAIQKRLTLHFDYPPTMVGNWLLDRAKVRQLFSALLGYSLRISVPGSSVCVRLKSSGGASSGPDGFTMEISCLTDTKSLVALETSLLLPRAPSSTENPLDYCLCVIAKLSAVLQGNIRWHQSSDQRAVLEVFLPSRYLESCSAEEETAEC